MSTLYIITFYAVITLLVILIAAAGFIVGRRNKPKSFPNSV